ncbi:MAG: hypothetical protein U1D30_19995 [Planctomycetota bacterium]
MKIRDGSQATVGGPLFFLPFVHKTHFSFVTSSLSSIADSVRGKWHIVEIKAYPPIFATGASKQSALI